jgi:hypothetical protein
MTELVYLALAFAFAIGCNIYDTVMSVKGIKAGVAVEANFTWLYGTDKPSALQYYAVNIPIIFLASALSIIGLFTHNPTLFYAGLAGPIVAGAKHIVGGREWAALLTAKK